MGVSTMSQSMHDAVDEVTSLFAQQNLHEIPTERIKALPAEERNLALNDLHAVADPIEESPELVGCKLQELNIALDAIKDKVALEEAVRQSPEYVLSWRLRFLRAERFQSGQAAERMVRHFETRKEMFGVPALGRDISLNDLTKAELAALKTGCVQALSHRDRAGRAVMVEMDVLEDRFPIETMMKLNFLMACMVSEEVAVQKDGVVAIFYAVGRKSVHTDRVVPDVENWLSFPMRLVALHDCYDNEQLHTIMSIASHTMEGKYLCRQRCHFGTHAACQANLALYGIPRHVIPLYADGSIDCTHHSRWMKQAQSKARTEHSTDCEVVEDDDGSTNKILFAGPKDVIMGRGQRKHCGNLKLRHSVESLYTKYEKASWYDRRSLCKDLFDQMAADGTRFISLKKEGFWEQVAEEVAVDRIAHMFRDYRREMRRNSKQV